MRPYGQIRTKMTLIISVCTSEELDDSTPCQALPGTNTLYLADKRSNSLLRTMPGLLTHEWDRGRVGGQRRAPDVGRVFHQHPRLDLIKATARRFDIACGFGQDLLPQAQG